MGPGSKKNTVWKPWRFLTIFQICHKIVDSEEKNENNSQWTRTVKYGSEQLLNLAEWRERASWYHNLNYGDDVGYTGDSDQILHYADWFWIILVSNTATVKLRITLMVECRS